MAHGPSVARSVHHDQAHTGVYGSYNNICNHLPLFNWILRTLFHIRLQMKLEIENGREKPRYTERNLLWRTVKTKTHTWFQIVDLNWTWNILVKIMKMLSPVCKPASYIASFLSSHLLPLILLVANRFRLVDFGLAMKVPGSTCSLLGRY